jgi:hypothetical protein
MMPADFLSGKRSPGWENPASPTFDRFLAAKIGSGDRFSSLHMNLGERLEDGITSPHVSPLQSWDGPSRPYPPMQKPLDAYDKIFAQGLPAPDGVDTKALLARDRSLLDFVTRDIKRTRARLAAPEGEKLDVYTESLRAIERKLVAEPGMAACRPPGRPAAAAMPAVRRAEIFVEMAAVALACGASRIANVFFNTGDYSPIGVPGPNVHDTVFHQSSLPEQKVQEWRMAQVAKAVARTRELGHQDTTLVVYADPNGNVHHGGGDSLFFITIGRLGGYFKGGQVLAHPKKTRAVNDVWTSIANAFGVAIDGYGDAEHSRGPLPGLA